MHEPRIVVLDDYFPRLETGFRVAEFNWLLEHHVVNEVMTTVGPLDEVAGPYRELHPELAELVTSYDAARLEQFDLAHVLFVTNAHRFLPDLVKAKLPFVLTIYPGGGLLLGTERGNRTLDDVFSAGLVRHVITTQPIVTDYIRARFSGVPVTEIIGVTTNPLYFLPGIDCFATAGASSSSRQRLTPWRAGCCVSSSSQTDCVASPSQGYVKLDGTTQSRRNWSRPRPYCGLPPTKS